MNSVTCQGHSLGGIITAGLLQDYPSRFNAALPMCGVLSGGVATWNTALDAEFAFQELIDPSIQVVNITDPTANLEAAEAAVAAAQKTAAGRARLVLVAALAGTPGWFTPLSAEPSATDYTAQEANQYLWESEVTFPFIFDFRAELESRAGGNPSWNTAVNYLLKNISFNGQISVPVLTMHTTGDGLVVPENEQAYKAIVDLAGHGNLLRQVFVNRAGHCAFTPAETITAVQTLENRLATGHWNVPSPGAMNAAATALGAAYNIYAVNGKVYPTAPAFISYTPARYLRPFDLFGRFRPGPSPVKA